MAVFQTNYSFMIYFIRNWSNLRLSTTSFPRWRESSAVVIILLIKAVRTTAWWHFVLLNIQSKEFWGQFFISILISILRSFYIFLSQWCAVKWCFSLYPEISSVILPYCLLYNSYDVKSENLVLDRLVI